ncbi:MAG: asparagine synthase (glutamine-hydrolyzing) [Candidatus Eisenbacteria bacterium]|nr:asparagine synthase (glutamine-hydrolyzing) [Candidatus Eisenbacteria bacterium]
MCGFAAWYDPQGATPDRAWLEAAAASIRHRGPDDEGFFSEAHVGLAFRRLAIVDVDAGHQPLSNEDGSIWIAFNGEIYNHAELRAELEPRGHRYRTHSDTETLVHAYEEWGPDFVKRLNGMFALSIWDRKRRRLFVARDRVGIKPLYWTRSNGAYAFASEIKALFAFPGVARAPRLDSVVEHLTLRYCAAPATMFEGIHKLPPGHSLLLEDGRETLTCWWHGEYGPRIELSDEDALAEVEKRLEASVKSHLMSEVPLGALLSGGVDSSLVVALMSRMSGRAVQTFSVGFDAPGPYSELPFARRVAEHCGTEHHEIVVGAQDLLRELPQLVWHQDEPVSEPAAIPTFLISQFARRTVTVVLTGEGGDELFAGYPKYAVEPYARALAHLPAPLRDAFLDHGIDQLPFRFRKLQVVGRSARFRDEADRLAAWFAGFTGAERGRLLGPRLREHAAAGTAPFRRALAASAARENLDRMLDVDVRTWLTDDLLMKMDKMSMAASIEARVPLLDNPLIEWAMRLSPRHKIRGLEGKVLLKRLARKLLPVEVVDRPKVGFTVPLSPWFRGEMREMLADTLLSPTALGRGYFEEKVLRGYVEDHLAGRRDRGRELWTLLTLELWHQYWIDRVPARATPWTVPARVAAAAPARSA